MKQCLAWGLVPGVLTALGGAYKDCLFEPFEPLKFWRSPIVSMIWYILIDRWYPTEPVLLKLGLASMLERLSVETYKAVLGKMPGKFNSCSCDAGKCVLHKDRGWLLRRLGLGDTLQPQVNVSGWSS